MYQDRSPGGGRDQIYDTINGLLTQSFVHWSQSLRTAMAALCKDGATFSITGIGGDLAQKRKLHTFSIIPSRSHPRTVQRRTVDSLRWNREDSEVLGVLVDGVLGSGEGAVLYAFDQDFINIGLVAHARAVGAGTPIAGTLFVRQKEQLVAGQPEEYANVSALYDKLESDEETNHFAGRAELQAFGRSPARGLRALFVVVASMALGRDSLSGIPGVSHEKGLLRYRDLAGWVGALVRAATDAEAEDGHEIVVDKDAMVRFYLHQFVARKPSTFVARWSALGVAEQARELAKLDYIGAERTMAGAVMPNIVDLMPALIPSDSSKCIITTLTRLLTDQLTAWNNTAVQKPDGFRYQSLVAVIKNGDATHDIEAPAVAKLDAADHVVSVWVSFPRGTNRLPQNPRTMAFYFGAEEGLGQAILRNMRLTKTAEAKPKPTKKCDVCFHDAHGDDGCVECGGECCKHCKKCLHLDHGTDFCSECIRTPGSFAKCIRRCAQCKHNGAFSGHKKNGCSECEGDCGCNLLKAKKRNVAAADDVGADVEQGDDDNDADDDDAEDEGVRGSLAEVLDSAVGAGIGVVEDAVAAIADAEDGDLGT